MKKTIYLIVFLLLPVSGYAQDSTIADQKQVTMSYANPITKDTVGFTISQLTTSLFVRNYVGDSLYEDFVYDTKKYPKLHIYLNNLFLQEIKPKVSEDMFYLTAYQNKVYLNFIRAFNIKDKQKIKHLMILVGNCYKANKDKVDTIPDEAQFLQTYCSAEIGMLDEYILSRLQARFKKVPISSIPLPKL